MARSTTPDAPRLQTAQIVLSVLIVGVMTLTVVAIFVQPRMGEPREELEKPLLLALGVLAIVEIPAYALLRKRTVRLLSKRHQDARGEIRRERIPRELLGLTLLGATMAEALGLFGAIIFLLTRQWLALIAPALAIVLIGVQIPGREWVEGLVRLARERA